MLQGLGFFVFIQKQKKKYFSSTYALKPVIDWHFKRICCCLIFFLKVEGWERDLFACEGGLDKKKREIVT